MKQVIDFLRRLSLNNNREWFHAHKNEYLEAKAVFDDFALKLLAGIRDFDDTIGPLTLADCTYRIYRDTRFSADKSPYKTHMGVFICKGGKKSDYSGYYFQVGPEDHGYDSGCMIASGNYWCDSKVLHLLREDIEFDEGRAFAEIIEQAKGFALDFSDSLKRIPKGFTDGQSYSRWLKLRNFCLVKDAGLKYVEAPDLIGRLVEDFKTTKGFIDFINRAIDFYHESR